MEIQCYQRKVTAPKDVERIRNTTFKLLSGDVDLVYYAKTVKLHFKVKNYLMVRHKLLLVTTREIVNVIREDMFTIRIICRDVEYQYRFEVMKRHKYYLTLFIFRQHGIEPQIISRRLLEYLFD